MSVCLCAVASADVSVIVSSVSRVSVISVSVSISETVSKTLSERVSTASVTAEVSSEISSAEDVSHPAKADAVSIANNAAKNFFMSKQPFKMTVILFIFQSIFA